MSAAVTYYLHFKGTQFFILSRQTAGITGHRFAQCSYVHPDGTCQLHWTHLALMAEHLSLTASRFEARPLQIMEVLAKSDLALLHAFASSL